MIFEKKKYITIIGHCNVNFQYIERSSLSFSNLQLGGSSVYHAGIRVLRSIFMIKSIVHCDTAEQCMLKNGKVFKWNQIMFKNFAVPRTAW